jgi:SNF2 family DNA or RNA helicase
MSSLVPREYQKLIIDHILEHERCNVFSGMGTGKSASVLAAAETLQLVEEGPILILAPLRVAQSTWPDEVKKWGFDLPITAVVGNAAQRAQALREDSAIYTLNYENVPWVVDWFKYNPRPWPFKTIVADEVTKLKGFRTRQGTKRAKALAEVAHKKVERWIGLTGTPAPNGLKDLYGPMWFVDGGERLGKSFTAFSQRWFRSSFDGYGLEPMEHSQKEIQALLADVCLSIEARDYFDLKIPISNKIIVDLPHKARQQYRDMEKKMFLELEGHLGPTEVEALNAASKTQKCLQLANGAIYTDEARNWTEVHDAKISALDDIIEEAGGAPVLVAYHFKHDLVRLRAAFPRGRVLDSDPETIRSWNAGKIPVLFAHPASAGHGLNLQDGGNIIVFFSVNWNLEEHQQIIERIGPTRQMQAGHNRPVFIHYILANDTVDFDVLERLESKRSVQDILLQAMKRHK